MSLTRRRFCQWLGETGLLAGAAIPLETVAQTAFNQEPAAAVQTSSHIGNLHPFVQQQADRSRLELSFLRPGFRDLRRWQQRARARVLEQLFYTPPPVSPNPEVIERVDTGEYVREYVTFQTTPDLRVPAYVLVPKNAKLPAPGLVVLHCHGGFYLWGKEKVVELEDEHPALGNFKQQLYQGKSIATELVRRGYVVAVTDMFCWGERRMLLDDDPPSYRTRERMTADEVAAFNRRAQQGEQLVARSLFTAGITWPGVMAWDDMRTVDYLASRPRGGLPPDRVRGARSAGTAASSWPRSILASKSFRRRSRKSRHVFARRAHWSASGAGSTTRRTSSTLKCRQKHGSGWRGGFESNSLKKRSTRKGVPLPGMRKATALFAGRSEGLCGQHERDVYQILRRV